jgi:phosphoribosylformylglycinamidine cyclo-ligase
LRSKRITYRHVGIDIKKIHSAHKSIGGIISLSHSFPTGGKVISGFGHYAGLIDIGSKVLALHSDSVGTKVIVAQDMNRFDTIGIDCIAMNVNDIICVGAQPLGFVDYIAAKSTNRFILQQIAKGLVEGARQSGIAIVGGETAILPEIIAGDKEKSFDLVGTALGTVDKSRLILGDKITSGDVILGVESSGLHSNGYTLARKVLLSKYSLSDKPEYLRRKLGEEMLTPTRIYVKPVMELLKQINLPVHGLAHITGGSFTKLARLNGRVRYKLDKLPEAANIFKQIQLEGNINTKEMYTTFNMGIGLCVIVSKDFLERSVGVFEKYKMRCTQIGIVDKKGEGEVIANLNGKTQLLSN